MLGTALLSYIIYLFKLFYLIAQKEGNSLYETIIILVVFVFNQINDFHIYASSSMLQR